MNEILLPINMRGPNSLTETQADEILAAWKRNDSRIDELSPQDKLRLAWLTSLSEEIVGVEHLVDCMLDGNSAGGDNVIRSYIGFEPSGQAHVGWLMMGLSMRRVLDAGANLLVFLADWHAWVNDKFGGKMEDIQQTARYMEEVFRVLLGNPPEGKGAGELQFLDASELLDGGDYWARVLRCAKGSTLARARKTLSIMGRDEHEGDSDLSKFLYPPMQAADIFEMDIDLAIGGMDQRKAHMYMRDVAERYGWVKATCLHTGIIPNLKSTSGRMDSFDNKMSKSDPDSAILLHDEPSDLKRKMKKAFLDPKNPNSPVLEIVKRIILPHFGVFDIQRPKKFGGNVSYDSSESLISDLASEQLHPLDVKNGVADALSIMLEPLRNWFSEHPEKLEVVRTLTPRK